MARPSEPLLVWLRKMLKTKGLNTAHVADACKLPRGRVRKILSGAEAMTVDELMMISDGLQLDPTDITSPALLESLPTSTPEDTGSEQELEALIDPWGNQPEQLFRVGFALGCDFLFLAKTTEIMESGVPKHVLKSYAGREFPVKLEAAYHKYNEPKYSPEGITLTLSFDQLYECTFPWTSLKQFVLYPLDTPPQEPQDEPEPKKGPPMLRLVT